ncbi:hypothetical protein BDV06DRAFT_192388 [Aspergillus oleicola]
MVMDDRPIAELRKRWLDIQGDKNRVRAGCRLDEVEENHHFDEAYEEEEYERERNEREGYERQERRVSFSPSPDEDEEEDVSSR